MQSHFVTRITAALFLGVACLLSACGSGGAAPNATPTVPAAATTPAIAPAGQAPSATSASAPAAPSATAEAPITPTAAPSAPAAPSAAPTDTAAAATPATTPAEAAGAPATPSAAAQAPGSTQKTALTLQSGPVETTADTRTGALAQDRTINLPAGFHIKVFAAGLAGVRWLGLSPDGLVYATLPAAGKVVTLPDKNGDGVADSVQTFADGLTGVHGIAFKDGAVYVATTTDIIRLQDTNGDGQADKKDVLATDLPDGGGHTTRTLLFGPDGNQLFVSAGSSCNVCVEKDPKRAAISLYSPDGHFQEIYASGLRNAVGLALQPGTGTLWATNNGRDGLGDNVPPETIYQVQEGANYGWPYCYGTRTPDKTQNVPAGYCEKTGVPAVEMQAHSAPLGLAFYTGTQFPAQFKGDLFVAFHGSWNRSVPTGYKVVRVRFNGNAPDQAAGDQEVEDFATGWLINGGVWGRPVDPLVAPTGSLLLTDDKAGVIYTIYYSGDGTP